MAITILSTPLAQMALSFVLVFTIVFAILQKSEILGKGKKQVDALVGLAVGLIVVATASSLEFIQNLIPFLGIALVVMFVFMVLIGMMYKEGDFKVENWMKISIGIVIAIFVIVVVLIVSGTWDNVVDLFYSDSSGIIGNIIILAIVVGAVLLVMKTGGDGRGSASGSVGEN